MLFSEIFNSIDGDTLTFQIDQSIYSPEAIFRTCYVFTGKCYLYLNSAGTNIAVYVTAKQQGTSLEELAKKFCNELINQQVRRDVARETTKVRELIVAQAFSDANLVEPTAETGDYKNDPKGITK